MKHTNPGLSRLPEESNPSANSTRRAIDATGLAIFHLAVFWVLGFASPRMAPGVLMLAVPVLGLDVIFYFSKPKQRPVLDPKPDPDHPEKKVSRRSFALELFVLLTPPAFLIAWFLTIIWQRRTMTKNELIGVVAGLPVVVGLVSWIIYLRMTRHHVGERNQTTQFIAITMLATWVFSTFLFVILAVFLVYKWNSF